MSSGPTTHTVPVERALAFAEAALQRHGLGLAHSRVVAANLIASDLLGHRTHGLAKLGQYVEMLKCGNLASSGDIEVIRDDGASFAWDAHRLPGAWVMEHCIEQLLARIGTQAVVAATIANCSHVGCLQTYLEPIVRGGYIAMLMASDPTVATVAPFGTLDPVLGPNPIAIGIPSAGDPILIDQCTSAVSNSEVRIAATTGQALRGPWLQDNAGQPTSDPAVISSTPRGTIMPLGGADLGHKGFGFGLMVEALALALSGYGRSETSKRPGGQGVFIQLINPEYFGGQAAFSREVDALTEKVKLARPIPGRSAPRLPGQRAAAMRRQQTRTGLEIEAGLFAQLQQLAHDLGIAPLLVHSS